MTEGLGWEIMRLKIKFEVRRTSEQGVSDCSISKQINDMDLPKYSN